MKPIESSLITIRNDSSNSYLFDYDNKYLAIAHPRLVEYVTRTKNNDTQEDDYYHRKYLYLVSNGIGEPTKYEEVPINAGTIDYQLTDLRQLVFEVTDSCNLKCKYCGYGEFYSDHDERHNKNMNFSDMSGIIDFLARKWSGEKKLSLKKPMFVSFYGGEPLLNMTFVKEAVDYFNSLDLDSRKFMFSMTTNAMLLDRHMDFLAQHDFHLLISLDGDSENHGYRVKFDGSNSFDKVITNIDLLQKTYPDYFKRSVNFNAVLHNKNSVFEINEYIKKRYDKNPMIGELNNTGIRPEKRNEFSRLYRNVRESLHQIENYEEYEKNISNSPTVNVATFIHTYLPFVYRAYGELIHKPVNNKDVRKYSISGTCLPFSKKMFVTVNGKILACERIGQQFSLGMAKKQNIELDSESIAKLYNDLYAKVKRQCKTCLRKEACIQCLFNLEEIDSNKKTVVCNGYMDSQGMGNYVGAIVDYLEKNPTEYYRIMTEVIIS